VVVVVSEMASSVTKLDGDREQNYYIHLYTKTTYAAQTNINQVSLCTLHLFQNKEDNSRIGL